MVKIILKQGKPITSLKIDGEVKLYPNKAVEIPLINALALLGDDNLSVVFEKKDEEKIRKLKRTRFSRIEREFGIKENSSRKVLLEKMFPKPKPLIKAPAILKKSKVEMPVKEPVKVSKPKMKPKVDKAKATQE